MSFRNAYVDAMKGRYECRNAEKTCIVDSTARIQYVYGSSSEAIVARQVQALGKIHTLPLESYFNNRLRHGRDGVLLPRGGEPASSRGDQQAHC